LARYLASLPAPDRATVELALDKAAEAQQSSTQILEERVDEQVSGPAGGQPATPTDASLGTPAFGRQVEQPPRPPTPPQAVPEPVAPGHGSATRREPPGHEAANDQSGEASGRSFGQARAAEAHGNAPDPGASGLRGPEQKDEPPSRGRPATPTSAEVPQP